MNLEESDVFVLFFVFLLLSGFCAGCRLVVFIGVMDFSLFFTISRIMWSVVGGAGRVALLFLLLSVFDTTAPRFDRYYY